MANSEEKTGQNAPIRPEGQTSAQAGVPSGGPVPPKGKKGKKVLAFVGIYAAAAVFLLLGYTNLHVWSAESCTEPAVCSVCGIVGDTPLGHDWGEWKLTAEPGCEEDGLEMRVCLRDKSHTETRSIAATGHDWGEWQTAAEPACDQEGTETRVCRNDSSHTENRPIAALGHDWGEWQTTAEPTCDQTGTSTRVCARDASHIETRSIAALGHDWMDATYDRPQTCSRCGAETGHVKGYIGDLTGSYSDQTVALYGYNLAHPFVLDQAVSNCMGFTMGLTITSASGNPYGTWIMYGRSDGKWTPLQEFQITRDFLEQEQQVVFQFSPAVSFDALAFVAKTGTNFSISTSVSYTDAQVRVD